MRIGDGGRRGGQWAQRRSHEGGRDAWGRAEEGLWLAGGGVCEGDECAVGGWGLMIRETWSLGALEPGVTGSVSEIPRTLTVFSLPFTYYSRWL